MEPRFLAKPLDLSAKLLIFALKALDSASNISEPVDFLRQEGMSALVPSLELCKWLTLSLPACTRMTYQQPGFP